MGYKPLRMNDLSDAAKAKAAKRAARLAEEAVEATAAFREWLSSPLEPKTVLRGALNASKNSALDEDISELLRELLAIHLSIAELESRPELTNGLLASVRYLAARRAFTSDAEMAEMLDVHRSQITRWKQGAPPDIENAERLVGLDAVVSLLKGFLEDESIPKWLRGINGHLDNRKPVDVLREGRLSEVIRAIEAEKSGAFA